jgi:hypothetical protein
VEAPVALLVRMTALPDKDAFTGELESPLKAVTNAEAIEDAVLDCP